MGASADQIESQIKETRDRIDDNLGVLEGRAASSAVRYGRIAAVVVGVGVLAGVGYLLYRRSRRPSLRDRLDGMSLESLKDLAAEASGRLSKRLPTVRVTVNERTQQEPGTVEAIVRKVAPAIIGTASSAVMDRVLSSDPGERGGARRAARATD